MTQISSGLQASTTVNYLPITERSVYQDSATSGVGFNPPVYPVSRINFPYYVVAHTLTSNGIGGTNRSNYFYRNGRSQALGRGFAGYATVEAHDLATNLLTITQYRQDYPYTGMVSQQRSLVNGSPINFKHTVNTGFANKHYGGTRYFPYVSTSTETNRDLNGAAIASFSNTIDYDLFGNLILHERRSDENHVFRETRQYLNDTVNWVIGKPTQLVTQHTLPDTTSLTRTAQMNYEPGTGFRTQEIIEPTTPALRVATDYTPDAFGNVRSTAISGSDILTRTTTLTYDPQGRFAVNISNPLGHNEQRAYDARFGTVTRHTSPNLIVTEWSYDSLGRKRSELRADGTQTAYDYTLCTTECTPGARHYLTTTATGAPTRIEAFDVLDRPIATAVEDFTASDTIVQITEYDAVGRVQRQSRPFFGSVGAQTWVSYTYDNVNRVRSKTHPDTGVVRTDYNGRVITMSNPRDHSTRYTKNSIGQTVRVDDARSGFRTYVYDPFGNLTRTQDQAGNLTTMTYDLRGRKRSMADPDMGNWTYAYNVLGETITQTDAKNQTSNMTYDRLGRMATRTQAGFTSSWTYDTAVKGIGKLALATATGGYQRSHEYDIYGRAWRTTTTIDAVPYAMTQSYDSVGRPEITTYPTGFATRNVYTSHGYLQQLLNHPSGALLWQADALNEDGNVTVETFGNALIGLRSYDATTGRLNILAVGPALDDWSVAALGFDYDRVGNLRERADWITGLQETFVYDELNRLTNVNGPAPKVYAYDLTGNLTSKTDVGSYAYRTGGSTRPHAVTQISLPLGGDIVRETSFNYDQNGSLTHSTWQERNTQTQQIVRSGPGHTVTWNSFNMPAQIQTAGSNMHIHYGAEQQKSKRVQGNGTLVYPLPNYEKFTRASDGLIEHRHTLYAGDRLIGQYTERSMGGNQTYYFHQDHLGSIAVISDEAGVPVERHSHDAFGLRRNPDGLDDPSGTLTSAITRIGYTGHEQLDNVRLIDMNARVYDPLVGRFLSADPTVPRPFDTQSHNRYSYAVNNPLSRVDFDGLEDCRVTTGRCESPHDESAELWERVVGGPMPDWLRGAQITSITPYYLWGDYMGMTPSIQFAIAAYDKDGKPISGGLYSRPLSKDELELFDKLGWKPSMGFVSIDRLVASFVKDSDPSKPNGFLNWLNRHIDTLASYLEVGGTIGAGMSNQRLSTWWLRYAPSTLRGGLAGAALGLEIYIVLAIGDAIYTQLAPIFAAAHWRQLAVDALRNGATDIPWGFVILNGSRIEFYPNGCGAGIPCPRIR